MHPLRQWRAQMRRAERDHVAHAFGPAMAAHRSVVAGAARDQAAHRMSDQRDVVDLDGPRLHQLFDQRRYRPAVLGDVHAAVVAKVHRRAAEVRGQPRAVRVARGAAAPVPVELRTHQTVQEQHHAPARVGKGFVQRGGVQCDRLAIQAYRRRLVKVAVRSLQSIADQATHGADHGASGARRRQQGAPRRFAPAAAPRRSRARASQPRRRRRRRRDPPRCRGSAGPGEPWRRRRGTRARRCRYASP